MAPQIIVFTGPMFAGKTSHLLKCWQSEPTPKYAFKYSNDTRYEDDKNVTRQIVSHNEKKIPAISISKCMEINQYLPKNIVEQISIFIDEGQFFKDIKQWLNDMAPNNIAKIYISGLDFDIFGNKFNQDFYDICEIATECHTLTARCYICNKPANYTQFIDNNSLNKLNDNILIGGSEQYQPVCNNHFNPIYN